MSIMLHNKEEIIFFFGAQNWLSQHYICAFTDDTGLTFNCGEQYFMYQKALLFDDKYYAAEILATKDPVKMKRLGKKVGTGPGARSWNDEFWRQHDEAIARRGAFYKFQNNLDPKKTLRLQLLSTGSKQLVETAPKSGRTKGDRRWGIGLTSKQALERPKSEWGQNLMGKAIEHARDKIRDLDEGSGCQQQQPTQSCHPQHSSTLGDSHTVIGTMDDSKESTDKTKSDFSQAMIDRWRETGKGRIRNVEDTIELLKIFASDLKEYIYTCRQITATGLVVHGANEMFEDLPPCDEPATIIDQLDPGKDEEYNKFIIERLFVGNPQYRVLKIIALSRKQLSQTYNKLQKFLSYVSIPYLEEMLQDFKGATSMDMAIDYRDWWYKNVDDLSSVVLQIPFEVRRGLDLSKTACERLQHDIQGRSSDLRSTENFDLRCDMIFSHIRKKMLNRETLLTEVNSIFALA
ncbi:hypothetical protein PVAG01_04176 [Phlyctema vagabunda]|uniref:NADAR domain-containing protein n=1 Tax=Phlyctema vagabunda TaxID=108571 RepID=A0ABR4PNN1_9HELO